MASESVHLTKENMDEEEIRKEWRRRAELFQQAMFVRLGGRRWDAIPAHNRALLQRKVGFALFGIPTVLPPVASDDQEGSRTGYTEDQRKEIDKYCDTLQHFAYRIHGCIYVSCVFIVGGDKHYRLIPVFKVLHKRNTTHFLIKRWQSEDIAVYPSWEKLQTTHLGQPQAIFCVPKHGTYTDRGNGQVDLWYFPPFTVKVKAEFTIRQNAGIEQARGFQDSSPSSQQHSEASSESSDSEATDGAADFEAPAEAVDCEEIEALNLGDVLNSHSSQVTCPSIEDAADLLPLDSSTLQPVDIAAMNLAFSIADCSAGGQNNNKSVSLAGLIALRDVVKLAQNATNLSDLQYFQFCSSFLFYTNRLVDPETVKRVVEDAQTELIESHEKSLTVDQRAEYDKLARPLRGEGSLHDKAKLVRQLIHIWDKDLFYDSLLEVRLDSQEHEVGFSDSVPGLINIDNAITLHPLKLSFLSPLDKEEFLNVCVKLKTNPTVDKKEFRKEIQRICSKHRLYFDFILKETGERLNQLARDVFGESEFKNLEVNNRKIFADMEPHELNRLGQTLRRDECNYDPGLVQITMSLAIKQCIERPQHFWCLLEFVINSMQERIRSVNDIYNEKRQEARTDPQFLKGDGRFDMAKFNASYGVTGKIKEFCRERALAEMGSDAAVEEMNRTFSQFKTRARALNDQLEVGFADEYAAAYHYLKHRKWGDSGELSAEGYFLIVKGLIQAFPRHFKSSGVSQYGDYIYIEYDDPSKEAFGVTYHWINHNCPKEIVATVFKSSNKVKIK